MDCIWVVTIIPGIGHLKNCHYVYFWVTWRIRKKENIRQCILCELGREDLVGSCETVLGKPIMPKLRKNKIEGIELHDFVGSDNLVGKFSN